METLVIYVLIFVGYFLPTIIASQREHNNAAAILMLNLFLGWTFLGWIAAIIWSVTDNTKKSAKKPTE